MKLVPRADAHSRTRLHVDEPLDPLALCRAPFNMMEKPQRLGRLFSLHAAMVAIRFPLTSLRRVAPGVAGRTYAESRIALKVAEGRIALVHLSGSGFQ